MTMLPVIGMTAEIAAEEQELAPIMVVGEKIERPLEETLSSVKVVTAEEIQEHGDTTLNEILVRTPGVYTQSDVASWGIRGVPVDGFSEQGPNTINSAVSVYLDDVLQPHRAITLNPMSLWDVEQVEIYRGPQSTVQGRNAIAGAVVFQTKDPTFKPTFAVRGNVGNHGQVGASVVAGGAIKPGVVAGRIAVDVQKQDGYIYNETLGEDANPLRNENIRGKLLILPSENLDVLLTVARTETRRGNESVDAVNGVPRFFSVAINTDAFDEIKQNALSAKVNYYFNDNWTLTSISSYSNADYDSLLDFDEDPDANEEAIRHFDIKSFAQEVRLGYKTPTLGAQFGVYYANIKNDSNERLDLDDMTLVRFNSDSDIENHAVFGEVNWYFTPRLQLIAGLRYDRERNETKAFENDVLGFFRGDIVVDEGRTYDAFLPKLGLSYDLAPNHLLGAVVQRGYRGGGVNLSPVTGNFAPYAPEYTTTYEVSYRGAWLNKALRTTANVYYTKWEDQQVLIRAENGNGEVANAGRSTMQGLELGLDYDVSRALTLSAGASYNDTEYKNFVFSGDNFSGLPFLYAPKKKFHVGGTYRATNQLTLSADAVYQDGSPTVYEFDAGTLTNTRRSDSVTLVNLAATYKYRSATLSAYVNNLFDKQYITTNQEDDNLDVGAPRVFGVALRYDFY